MIRPNRSLSTNLGSKAFMLALIGALSLAAVRPLEVAQLALQTQGIDKTAGAAAAPPVSQPVSFSQLLQQRAKLAAAKKLPRSQPSSALTSAFVPSLQDDPSVSDTVAVADTAGCNRINLPLLGRSGGTTNPTGPALNLSSYCMVVGQGGLVPVEVGLSAPVSFTSELAVSVTGLPSGVQASFSQASVSRTKKTSVLVGAGFDVPAGSYRLTLRGQVGSTSVEAPLILVVKAKIVATGLIALNKTSPSNGEQDVAVTRETVLSLNGAIDPASVSEAAIYAQFGGQKLPARLHVSADKTQVTLFYSSTLPASARVRVTVNGDLLQSASGQKVDADGDGAAGGTGLVDFDTLSLTTVPGTQACGRVFASQLVTSTTSVSQSVNLPLPGVKISVDGSVWAATTDAGGNFCLNPAPVGRFFVHIDGRTATAGVQPNTYYPFLGKAWEAIAGRVNNVGDFYLPLIPDGTLQQTSATADTVIHLAPSVVQKFADYADVSLFVPANAALNENGTRGGKVGIAPVPPDRMPGSLPAWLQFPIVITVQTDGAENFDRPVGACFPNLPDLATDVKLKPGEKNYLYSFNHDTGRFEPVGPMTASADGRVICTDPGVGIPAPGWHGSGPPPYRPPPDPPPPLCPITTKHNATNQPLDPASSTGTSSVCSNCYRDCAITAIPNCLAAARLGGGWVGCLVWGAATFAPCGYFCYRDKCQDPCSTGLRAQAGPLEAKDSESLITLTNRISAENQDDPDDPVLDAVTAEYKKAISLIEPYAATGTPIPQNVIDEVRSIGHTADLLTGGNAISYIRNAHIATEARGIQDTFSNAPNYPIRYVAAIQRDNGDFLLQRGLSSAFGQYEIFIPNDGALIGVAFYDYKTRSYGLIHPFATPSLRYRLPRLMLHSLAEQSYPDTDGDGLMNIIEIVYGTNPNNLDSDGDGITDGAEVDQGTNPLDGLPTLTGIIGSSETPGTALDVCATNDIVAVADADKGVAVFNVFNRMNPTLIAQVDTPGYAQAVACAGNLIVVADKSSGLAVIDISDPAAARITQQVNLGSDAVAVAIAGNVAYVGLANGKLAAVDIVTGQTIDQLLIPGAKPVQDVVVVGDYAYIYTETALQVVALDPLLVIGSVNSPAPAGMPNPRGRLFVGGGIAYLTHAKGYNTINVSNPVQPLLIQAGNGTQFGWNQLVANGSGLGVAAVGNAKSSDGPHDVDLYDISNSAIVSSYLTTLQTPGVASAVAIYNGMAYVADGASGLQVINYQAFDAFGKAPTMTLQTNFTPGFAEEGAIMRVSASVTDDVQIRNVELYVDGVRVSSDGSFPFEMRFTTPRIAQQSTFTLTVRATDTGGNTAVISQVLRLLTDATPPRVRGVTPIRDALIGSGSVTVISATFSEPMNASGLTNSTFQLFSSGPDGILGNGDDVLMTGGAVSYASAINSVLLTLTSPLAAGRYKAVIASSAADPAGNSLGTPFVWSFLVVPTIQIGDTVADGIGYAGEEDIFRFTAAPGQQVFFDLMVSSPGGMTYMDWQLKDSSGAQIFNQCFGCGDPGVKTLIQGGLYTLTVSNISSPITGTYSFKLWNVPAPQQFAISVGDTISNGVPGLGAGNIESPGVQDIYTFNASPGQQVFFDLLVSSPGGMTYMDWQLKDSSGAQIFNQCFGCGDPGVKTLAQGGFYTITVGDAGDPIIGTYSFKLWNVPAPQQFAISVGDTISNGVPGLGAGNIESPGVQDIYTFNASPGQQVFFDLLVSSPGGMTYMDWQLKDSSGAQIFNQCFGCGDPGVKTLAQGGFYTITVGDAGDPIIGTYRFQLRNP